MCTETFDHPVLDIHSEHNYIRNKTYLKYQVHVSETGSTQPREVN